MERAWRGAFSQMTDWLRGRVTGGGRAHEAGSWGECCWGAAVRLARHALIPRDIYVESRAYKQRDKPRRVNDPKTA